MFVVNRRGEKESVQFDSILNRLLKISTGLNVNCAEICTKIIKQMVDGITTTALDKLTAEQCMAMSSIHPDYQTLASRIVISNHHKNTPNTSFSTAMEKCFANVNQENGNPSPLISESFMAFVREHAETLDAMIDYQRDYLLDTFGFQTLANKYLLTLWGDKPCERPQDLWMRVAVAIHMPDLDRIRETYEYTSTLCFTHATPTLFNAGGRFQQFSSCFLVAMKDDSIEGIFDTVKECAVISKYAGGIGMHVHNIRARQSYIAGTNGVSSGLIPMLGVFNKLAKYVDQGGGKRKGSIAVFLEPWHLDIEDFLTMRRNHGEQENKCRDLFYGLWIPDLFMERVRDDKQWTLMCPNTCPGLDKVYGQAFNALYESYEAQGKGRKTIKARDLWMSVMTSQIETGTPYICFKDAVNQKSNQQNLGTIRSSNLCVEVNQFSSSTETAVCNLASISLPAMVSADGTSFDFDKLGAITRVLVRNLNQVIDRNFYPVETAERSNRRHRPIGIGIQGLADVFFRMNMAFESQEARALNQEIAETMYFHALSESVALAQSPAYQGKPYETFAGSPLSKGQLQCDLWGKQPEYTKDKWDWDTLRKDVMTHGCVNSLLIAPMPTASTSQILGNTECFEPVTSNIFTRSTLAGTFVVVNKYMIRELVDMGEWNEQVRQSIIANDGSVQQLVHLPESFRKKYKTAWEMSMRTLIDMAADRGPFVCQSQSLNLFVQSPKHNTINAMLFHAWTKGLKTGCYYLRSRAKQAPQKFSVPVHLLQQQQQQHSPQASPTTAATATTTTTTTPLQDYPETDYIVKMFMKSELGDDRFDMTDERVHIRQLRTVFKNWLHGHSIPQISHYSTGPMFSKIVTKLNAAMNRKYDFDESADEWINIGFVAHPAAASATASGANHPDICENCSA